MLIHFSSCSCATPISSFAPHKNRIFPADCYYIESELNFIFLSCKKSVKMGLRRNYKNFLWTVWIPPPPNILSSSQRFLISASANLWWDKFENLNFWVKVFILKVCFSCFLLLQLSRFSGKYCGKSHLQLYTFLYFGACCQPFIFD